MRAAALAPGVAVVAGWLALAGGRPREIAAADDRSPQLGRAGRVVGREGVPRPAADRARRRASGLAGGAVVMSVAALAAGRIHPSLFAVALGVLAAVRSALRSVAAERERRRRRDDVIVTLREFERGLRAGLSDLEAFRAAVVFPLRAAGIADAVAEWSGALEGEAARAASASLLIGVALGALHPQYVASVSALLAQQRRSEEEAQSQSSQARLSAVVMALAPLLFFVGLVLTDPRASRLMLHTLLGTVILGVGLLFDAAAFMWMRRIVGSAGRGQGR